MMAGRRLVSWAGAWCAAYQPRVAARLRRRAARWLLAGAFGTAAALPAAAAEALLSPFPIERDDHSRIDYYLERRAPSARGGTLLVVLQGSDCNSVTRVEAVRRDLAGVLPDADLLTIEKYGITAALPYNADPDRTDCPLAYLEHDTPMRRARDATAVVARLAAENGYAKVVAIGGSEGAVVANLLTARSTRVDATIAFGGGGRWFLDDVLHSIAVSDMPAAQRAQTGDGMRALARSIADGEPVSAMSGHGVAWWRAVFGIDQLAVLRETRTPVLLIQGAEDEAASTAAARRLAGALARAGRDNVRLVIYPGLDHRLRGRDGVSQMARVTADMSTWLRERGFAD